MAIDYTQYAKMYGGGNVNQGSPSQQAAGTVGLGMGRAFAQIPTFQDKFNQRQTDELNDHFGSAGFSSLLNPDITTWQDVDIPNAGKAYLDFKAGIKDDTGFGAKRFARKSKKLLNPMAFKQEYDKYMQTYLPSILTNLSTYAFNNKKTPEEMRELLKDKPGLKSLLVRSLPQEQLVNYPYLAPEIGLGEAWGDAWENLGQWGKDRLKPENILGTAAYGIGGALGAKFILPRAWNLARGRGFTAGGGGGAATGGAAGGAIPKSTSIGTGGKQTNLFKKAMSQVKGKGMKAALTRAMTTLGKTRGLALLARLGPYGLIAAVLGGGAYALYKSKDTYQTTQDQRLKDTYGGGPVDTSGAAGIEAARQKMAAYNAKYGK